MRKEPVILGAIGLATLVLLIGAAFFLSKPQDQQTTTVTDTTLLLGKEHHTIGSSSAKVTIVEFGDFQCPACAAAHPVVDQILGEYEDQVYFVFRHFPLPGHRHARIAARAAQAAGVQGKFFEMYDLLFTRQADWSELSDPQDTFLGYAEELELDLPSFKEDQASDALNQDIQDDQNAGIQLGVNSTPTFFVNGVMYPGVLTYDRLKQLIDEQLQQ